MDHSDLRFTQAIFSDASPDDTSFLNAAIDFVIFFNRFEELFFWTVNFLNSTATFFLILDLCYTHHIDTFWGQTFHDVIELFLCLKLVRGKVNGMLLFASSLFQLLLLIKAMALKLEAYIKNVCGRILYKRSPPLLLFFVWCHL